MNYYESDRDNIMWVYCPLAHFRYIGRIPSASVATGNKAIHKTEQESVRTTTFKF